MGWALCWGAAALWACWGLAACWGWAAGLGALSAAGAALASAALSCLAGCFAPCAGTRTRSSIVAHWYCWVRLSNMRESSPSSSTCIWFLGVVAYLVNISVMVLEGRPKSLATS